MDMWPWPRIFIFATAPAIRTTSGHECGGRHAYLCACRIDSVDAIVDCWGGNVIVDDKKLLNAKRPTAPIDLTDGLRCPLLGLFGNDDENPNKDQVNRTEAILKRLGKTYEFHRYDGAGHAFFNTSVSG